MCTQPTPNPAVHPYSYVVNVRQRAEAWKLKQRVT